MRIIAALCLLSLACCAQPFEHIVIVVQENRSVDNLFGSNPTFEPGVDIAVSGQTSQGLTVPLTPAPLASCFGPSHTHNAFLIQFNKGAMDGFDKLKTAGCAAGAYPLYRYVDNSTGTVQPYFDLATGYGCANRMFQSNQGPSFPAHQFLISGSSAPDDNSDLFAANNPTINFAGCASPASATVPMIDPNGIYSLLYPCFNLSTLPDLFEASGLTWHYYAVSAKSMWAAPSAISHLCNAQMLGGELKCSGAEWENVTLKPATFLTDIGNCKLANVTWVTPTGQNSDHSQTNRGGGPSWVASIVNAIGSSSCGYWQNTAIIITWDDWGGWYDHVPPAKIIQSGWGKGYVYGFRVPLLVVSAYTPASYVSNSNHDFGSILRFVENNFSLGLIGPGIWADSYADDLGDFFAPGPPKAFTAIRAPLGPEYFLNDAEPASDPDDD